MSIGLGYCLDCDGARELKPNGHCSTCDSNSTMKLKKLDEQLKSRKENDELEKMKEDVVELLNYNFDED